MPNVDVDSGTHHDAHVQSSFCHLFNESDMRFTVSEEGKLLKSEWRALSNIFGPKKIRSS
jgi:hypothetical protein